MSTTPWRGTLLFVGSLATIAVAAVSRFAVAPGTVADGTSSAGTSSSATPATSSTGPVQATPGSSPTPGPADTSSGGASSTSSTVVIVGNTVQTRYGPVQVSVTFTGKAIVAAQALQVPGAHEESVQINAVAAPILNQETVAAGSAKIDTVSGATFTSGAYRESLQSAIDLLG